MEFISSPFVEKNKGKELIFNRDGQEIGKDQKNQKFYAKVVVKDDLTSYYISVYQNVLFNPSSISESREKYKDIKMKKVQKDVFDFYMMFLSTKKMIYMTKAQRMFMNGN
jgi:hypothetical protein